MDAAIIQSGSFTSTGLATTLQIRSDFDWIQTYNLTAINQAAADLAAVCYWQVGMTSGRGIVTTKLGTVANDPTTIGQLAAGAGFTPVDSAGNPLGAQVATTDISNALSPIVLTGTTPSVGSIVRLYGNEDAVEVNGYDFSVQTVNAGVSFTLGGAFPAALDQNGAQAGFYRVINYQPLYYPRYRYIMNITRAAQAVVTLTVPSGYVVGQTIRLSVPPEFGMIELDGQVATIVAVNDALATQTITINIDTTNYTAFAFPTAALYPFTPAMVVPVGENTAYAIQQAQNILSDATYNTGYIGVVLAAGVASPAGQANDAIYWVAGKSSYTQNP